MSCSTAPDKDCVQAAVEEVAKITGDSGVDYLTNNAGIANEPVPSPKNKECAPPCTTMHGSKLNVAINKSTPPSRPQSSPLPPPPSPTNITPNTLVFARLCNMCASTLHVWVPTTTLPAA